ncbi:MAG: hypothetical protein KDC87_12420 [Planctomycetes bacterium]|nr:hypothetical protein [Planctomycetota bacterium]
MSKHLSTAGLHCGEWVGYYEQWGVRTAQRMTLEFADGIVRGRGADELGVFEIEGEFRSTPRGCAVGWIKTYDGAHSVLYLGHVDDGAIDGKWEIGWMEDAFHIEPGEGRGVREPGAR